MEENPKLLLAISFSQAHSLSLSLFVSLSLSLRVFLGEANIEQEVNGEWFSD